MSCIHLLNQHLLGSWNSFYSSAISKYKTSKDIKVSKWNEFEILRIKDKDELCLAFKIEEEIEESDKMKFD